MKYIFAVIVSMSLLSGVCFGADKVELKDQKDRESYSLGYGFGKTLKDQGLSIDLGVYTSAIKDALAGTNPALNEEEMNKALSDIKARATAAYQKGQKEKAEKNLAEGKAFLENNKKKDGVVTLPSGIEYSVLKEGTGKTPKATDEVTVGYTASFIDGTEFDSSYKKGKPFTFQLDKVIPGWKEALQLMKEGSKWRLVVPPELAYGEPGRGIIPPNAVLVFEIELVSVK